MAYLVDCVYWRADESFSMRPFDLYDGLVLSFLSYCRLPSSLGEINGKSLSEIASLFPKRAVPIIATMDGKTAKKDYAILWRAVTNSCRYGSMKLMKYEEITDHDASIQFGAVAFNNDNGDVIASFRGTDETIVGWKENCELSYTEVPAQRKAAEFASNVFKEGRNFFICGHSKGGNLALYGATHMSERAQKGLTHLYLYDSPGLCEDVFGKLDIEHLNKITTHLIPGYDVVGQIFPMGFSNTIIVKADQVGVLQHAFLSWRLEQGKFVTMSNLSPDCDWINQVLKDWLMHVDKQSRNEFVNGLFKAVTSHGEKTLYDLGKNPMRTVDKLLIGYFHAPKKEKRTVQKLGLAAFFGTSFREAKHLKGIEELFTLSLVQGILMILIGGILIAVPESLTWIVIGIASLGLLFLFAIDLYCLILSKWNVKNYSLRLWVLALLILIYAAFIVSGYQTINSLSYIGAGIFFFVLASTLALSLNKHKSRIHFALTIIEIVMYSVIAICLLFLPSSWQGYVLFGTGIILVIDGIYKLVC